MGKEEFKTRATAILIRRIEAAIRNMVAKQKLQQELAPEEMVRMASWLVTYHHGDLDDFFRVREAKSSAAIARVYTRDDFRSLVENLLIPQYRIVPVIEKVSDVLYSVYQDVTR